MSPTITGLSSLSLQLTKSRFAIRQGESLLYLASILAYAVSSALALTVAGGTLMFFQRAANPTGLLAEALAEDPTFDVFLTMYAVLAVVACALLIPSLAGLAGSAAVLGARGRERRLAALRLLGLSAGDVTRISLIDALIQAVIGCAAGTAAYFATLPLWGNLTMQAVPVDPAEMLLPWFGVLGILAATVVIGLVASWWGLRQVRISPLGVARRGSRPGLKVWRPIAFVALLGIAIAGSSAVPLGATLVPWLVIGGFLIVVVWGLNLVAPWVLQHLSRLVAQAPWPSLVWAARRVQANPKATWQQVSGIALLCFISGYVAMMPVSLDSPEGGASQSVIEGAVHDFTKGALITLAVGLALAATSVLINQASAVLERAEQARALDKMGSPRSFLTKASWLETLGPLVLGMALGVGLGAGMAGPVARLAATAGESTLGPLLLGTVLALGLALVCGALLASRPLQTQVLGTLERRAD